MCSVRTHTTYIYIYIYTLIKTLHYYFLFCFALFSSQCLRQWHTCDCVISVFVQYIWHLTSLLKRWHAHIFYCFFFVHKLLINQVDNTLSHSIYIQNIYCLSPKWHFNLTFFFDHHHSNGNLQTPKPKENEAIFLFSLSFSCSIGLAFHFISALINCEHLYLANLCISLWCVVCVCDK